MSDEGTRGRLSAAKSDEHREVWSFFSGAMGLDLGLEAAGIAPTLAVEIDPKFCQTIRTNRPALDLIEGDVTRLNAEGLRAHRSFDGEVFLMAGGPPCQPFSSGGRRAALNDPRGNLIYEYFRLIGEVKPRYFVLENVANLTTAALRHRPINERPGKHWSLKRYANPTINKDDCDALALEDDELSGSALRQIIRDADALGYHISFGVVDAADFGSPQHRLRFVMLGSRDHPPTALPLATHGVGEAPLKTVRDAIYGLRDEPGQHSAYTDGVRKFFEMVPEGGNWRSLSPDMQKAALGKSYFSGGGKTGFFRRLAWGRPAPTITGRANRKGSALCHPEADRPISVREAAALQGFPDDWQFIGAMNTQYMQIGNAVPVELGMAIGNAIVAHDASKQRRKVQHPDAETMIADAVERLRAAARNKIAKAA